MTKPPEASKPEKVAKPQKAEKPRDETLDETTYEAERTRKLKLENDETERKLIPEAVFEAACDLLVGPALVDLLSLPARVTDDLKLRRLLEDEIDGIRTRHADRLERVLGDVLAGKDLDGDDCETDDAAGGQDAADGA